MKEIKKIGYKLYTSLLKPIDLMRWNKWVKSNEKIKIIIGASKTNYPGWFQTEQYFLDLTNRNDFVKLFSKKKMDGILAEHVLEHLTNDALHLMLQNFKEFTSDSVTIRIAVPDGFHGDDAYINNVKPGGVGFGSDDHKNLFTYKSLAALFETAGFVAHPVEYWDENRVFHKGYVNDDNGYIKRSFINDKRNAGGNPVYTSLIIDFTKK
jgi:predicted SAM-dependent methyltransferase